MTPFPIPVVAIGPGSQPEDEPFDYMRLPQGMSVYTRPPLEDVRDPIVRGRVVDVLETLVARMRGRTGDAWRSLAVDLAALPPDVATALNDVLGDGEVCALSNVPRPIRIQETAFAGLWRVVYPGHDGQPATDTLEVCAIPGAIRQAARAGASARVAMPPAPGVMNAPALVDEILDVAKACVDGAPAHVVNLTLLPVTPEDLDHLVAALGAGTTAILSRGYGNCRISSTAVPDVWWVQYYNSTDQLILNTIEVVDVPDVALAADEDIADSLERLEEYLDELRSA
jgi:hydrogenase-1 operon protein HyaF